MWSDSGVPDHLDDSPDHLLGIALRIAREAADAVIDLRSSAITDVATKSSATDVVTAADKAVEQLVRDRLARHRPGDEVLGEEGGSSGQAEPGSVLWVVDPIDGTVNYLYGLPGFAVSLAAQIDGVSVAGVVVDPVSGRCWTAAQGAGAHLDGAPLHVSATTEVAQSLIATGFSYREERRRRQAAAVAGLLGSVRDIRRSGSAALDLCAVATGWVDAYLEHGLGRWDWAAGALIAREAGALVSLPGEDVAGLGADAIFACTPGLARELRSAAIDSGFGAV